MTERFWGGRYHGSGRYRKKKMKRAREGGMGWRIIWLTRERKIDRRLKEREPQDTNEMKYEIQRTMKDRQRGLTSDYKRFPLPFSIGWSLGIISFPPLSLTFHSIAQPADSFLSSISYGK